MKKAIVKLKKWVRKAAPVVIKAAPLLCAIMLCVAYELGVWLDKKDYHSVAVYLYETVNSNLATGIILIAICSYHKLCLYNWLASYLIIATSVFNIIATYLFDESNYDYYTSLYSTIIIPAALFGIGIAFTKRNPKKNVRRLY